jgi:transcriptional regulator with XRE-family HTH domain
MSESEEKELYEYLSDPEVRRLYLDSSIRQLLAMQLRKMREARGLKQEEVGDKAEGMKQSAIARLEDPRYISMTLATLKRLAKAFDVALIVRFAPFSEFISWTANLDEQRLSPPSFTNEFMARAITTTIEMTDSALLTETASTASDVEANAEDDNTTMFADISKHLSTATVKTVSEGMHA